MTGLDACVRLADQWRAARADTGTARDRLAQAVRDAHDHGATEYRLAQATGLTRTTIRDMLGKPRGGTP